ncbi:polyribonucleotide nucleotidyltransferase [Rickettsiales bacterium]|nr:polyribonucleotide nucleotidyltransferase [Rickettsiales bacterium]MDB2550734.1 polyribonucleotide nucleotidyltransferase [Rickettsiales bacterium]
MFNEIKKEIEWGGYKLSLETGKVARQASGSVIAKMGDTTVLCAVTVGKNPLEGADFLPLTINYIEKYYASGKIPGGFFKREAKPSELATLTSRLIDRPIRPLFPNNFRNEINVVCQILSYDKKCNPDIVAMIAASAALHISEAPFLEAIAGARVGYVDGEYVLNPDAKILENSKLDLILAGTNSSVLMVESEASELSEEVMLGAVKFGHEKFQPIINLINELKEECGKEEVSPKVADESTIDFDVKDFAADKIENAYKIQDKQERVTALDNIKSDITEKFLSDEVGLNKIDSIFKKLSKDIVRGSILKDKVRIDGRSPEDVRQIKAEVGILPQVHGSALFTRGETQALVVTTIGSSRDEQMVDGIDGSVTKETLMLHYNFPPYSVGEVGFLKPPGRREIGHGKLALRAINPVFPNYDEFQCVTRIVSEITESNGSSSMATVCGASLSLMDAGVPIPKPVSGIAMGLIKEGDDYVVLSDIMGDEDHLGDMDFKVAGTQDGITALQMDIKISGISYEIMDNALAQAKSGRGHILSKMAEALSSPRQENNNIPKSESMKISPKKIKDLIGPKGKNIKAICEKTGVIIDVDQSGVVKLSSSDSDKMEEAMIMIKESVFEPEIGDIYEGTVVKVINAGAFVNIFNNKDGFVHISELANHRVDFVEDIVNEGDIVKVKVIGFDKKFRPKLSYRSIDQETGEDISHLIESDDLEDSKKNETEEVKPPKKRGFFG